MIWNISVFKIRVKECKEKPNLSRLLYRYDYTIIVQF